MTDLNKEREAFAQTEFNTFGLDVKDFKTTGEYFMFIGWLMRLELEKAKAQAVPEGWVIAPQELPLDMALKIAKERILEQPPVKDPVLNEILEKAHKENIQSEQCRLMRDYKEMVKRLSESGAEK
ncbi:hypothetical protein [Acinetobacter baumannii]|uniref:hypothetical protein n=1 Tax=Acinetobacter baumannii TaxID=470 RepID=UPI000E9E73E4|nr:hypothetical protein [Acinetobacter baumannii]AXX53888.1 hypothetical protein Aba9102_16670 [Acinetobacter baumannii]